jgi:hypothetical protein
MLETQFRTVTYQLVIFNRGAFQPQGSFNLKRDNKKVNRLAKIINVVQIYGMNRKHTKSSMVVHWENITTFDFSFSAEISGPLLHVDSNGKSSENWFENILSSLFITASILLDACHSRLYNEDNFKKY